ncbi:hypothetical protein [Pseudanabaena sp. PCC 6802]|uniref:hypothetical protein n=1 Tax=Pseudanabaena sp. PCC 6802 TaxID=118173 RepID=UPI00034498F2|nr:hypothetical protein [Pseudanabaena sp. PCC 6802]
MNTLKEIVDFVGIPQGSLEVARFGGPWIKSLGKVSLLVTRRERPASMRAIIQALQNLTPITLEAEIVGSRSGEEPFEPKIRVNASGGITWFTTIEYHQDGVVIFSKDVNDSGGDFTPTQLGRGSYQLVVTRSGISNTGFVSLRKLLSIITVSATPTPTPTPLPTPAVTCSAELDLDQPGFGGIVGMRIFGGGFLPSETVNIFEGGQVLATTNANAFGQYSVHVSFLSAQFPVKHTVNAQGQASGRISNNAGFTV